MTTHAESFSNHTSTCGLTCKLLLNLMVLWQVNRSCSDAEASVPGNHGRLSTTITVHKKGGQQTHRHPHYP